MTTKPDLIKWVTDDDALKISDPGATKKLAGWIYKEKPAFQFFNWLFNRLSKWVLGLQGNFCDIIIGSAAQVTAHEATHIITALNDALAVAGSRVLLLDGTHTLTGNLSLSSADLKITSESPLAILNVSTFTATFSGARNQIVLRVTNSGAGDVIISGAGSIFEGVDIPIANVAVSNGAIARTSGTAGGIKQSELIGNASTATQAASVYGVVAPTIMAPGYWPIVNANGPGVANWPVTLTLVDFNAKPIDTNGDFDLSTDKFTPLRAGYYLIITKLRFIYCVAGDRLTIHMRKNGAAINEVTVEAGPVAGTNFQFVSLSEIVQMNGTTDYIDITAANYDNATSSLSNSQFIATRIG